MNNFDTLIQAIENKTDFDYTIPRKCVGAVCKELLGVTQLESIDGTDAIKEYLKINKSDAWDVFWGNGKSFNKLTKQDALTLIRQMKEKYKGEKING